MSRVAIVYNACIVFGLAMQGAGMYLFYGLAGALISTGFSVLVLTVLGAALLFKGH